MPGIGSAGRRAAQGRDGLANETPPEPQGDSLGPVGSPELAEQPSRMCLDGVLGQIALPADLTVALAGRHAVEHLALPLGQLWRAPGRRRELTATAGLAAAY